MSTGYMRFGEIQPPTTTTTMSSKKSDHRHDLHQIRNTPIPRATPDPTLHNEDNPSPSLWYPRPNLYWICC